MGWEGRNDFSDTRNIFNYVRISEDNRIIFGGESPAYYYGNRPGSMNNKKILLSLEKRLLTLWPQLEAFSKTLRHLSESAGSTWEKQGEFANEFKLLREELRQLREEAQRQWQLGRLRIQWLPKRGNPDLSEQ